MPGFSGWEKVASTVSTALRSFDQSVFRLASKKTIKIGDKLQRQIEHAVPILSGSTRIDRQQFSPFVDTTTKTEALGDEE